MTDGAGMTLNALKLIQEAMQEMDGETVTLPRFPLNDLLGRTIAQAEENRRLREVLAWYADAANWKRRQGRWDRLPGGLAIVLDQESSIELDRGNRARAVLSAAEAQS